MKNFFTKSFGAACLFQSVAFVTLTTTADVVFAATQEQSTVVKPLTLQTMGSFFFGGTVQKTAAGETFHGDHGYAQYYIPQNAKEYPIIMWHGIGQSGRSFESTPDGREGFQAMLPRDGFAVYLIDQPRRGRAGYTLSKAPADNAAPTTSMESSAWDAFRNGIWVPPNPATLFADVQFPSDASSIDQFFRQQTPNTGEEPRTNEHRLFMGQTMAVLLDQTGPAILVTHSNSGQYGWFSGIIAQDKIKAIVAFEPGQMTFPEGEKLADIATKNALAGEMLQPIIIPIDEFKKLTKMPIVIIYGDNISSEPSEIFNVEVWRLSKARAKEFVDLVNKYGGDATLMVLPEMGIKGNTHAPFGDLNNRQIADLMESWLHEKGLDGNAVQYSGPAQKKIDIVTIPLQK